MNDLETVQDYMIADLLESEETEVIETVQLFHFMKNNAVPFSQDQKIAMLMLKENGLDDIANYAIQMRRESLPMRMYNKLLETLTMADRIKGTAKFSQLMKASMQGNPAQTVSAKDMQMKGMHKKDLK